MSALAHQRCFHHSQREAVARCPQCRQFYCRECITEHDDRVICASCLRVLSGEGERKKSRATTLVIALPCAAGLLMLWVFFYVVGQILLLIPSSYHEGTLWADRIFQ